MALFEIDSDLKTAEATLRHWETKYPEVVRREARAKVDYELAWAAAVDAITRNVPEGGKQPTVAVLEAEATRICSKELTEKRLAEAEAEIGKKLIGIAETTLTSIQSRAKLELIEAGLAR